MPNYLTKLTSQYHFTGTGDLIDLKAAQNWTEQGTVALTSGDGPPPNQATTRGPMSSTTTGFQHTWSLGGPYDIRGAVSCWFFCWFKLASFTTEHEIFAICTNTENQKAVRLVVDKSFDTVLAHMWDGTSAWKTTGPASPIVVTTGIWYFAGFYYDATRNRFACHLGRHFSEIDGTVGGFPHSAQSQARIGHTATGSSLAGLNGNIGLASWFKGYAPTAADINHFYRAGAGQRYPQGYRTAETALVIIGG